MLSEQQVEALFAACTRLRDQALLGLLLDTGLRIGEAFGIGIEDGPRQPGDGRSLRTTARHHRPSRVAGRPRGKEELPGSAERPGLADAAWNNRARTALPNGLCGLPRQQSCAHSNKCLSCPVFITTSADLPAHEEQRRRTLKLIAELDDRGDESWPIRTGAVLEQLDERITQIRRNLDLTNAVGEELGNAG